jgi:thiol-disulfide isomerase/thioredoxin
MALFTEILSQKLKKYGMIVLVLFLIILFIWLSFYCYKNIYKPFFRLNQYTDVVNAPNDVELIIYFFHTDWCPYCTAAKPEWDKFKAEYNNRVFGNYKITCKDENCTIEGDSSPEAQNINELMSTYKVEYFPTIKMIKDGDTIDFDAKVNYSNLSKFLEAVLNTPTNSLE